MSKQKLHQYTWPLLSRARIRCLCAAMLLATGLTAFGQSQRVSRTSWASQDRECEFKKVPISPLLAPKLGPYLDVVRSPNFDYSYIIQSPLTDHNSAFDNYIGKLLSPYYQFQNTAANPDAIILAMHGSKSGFSGGTPGDVAKFIVNHVDDDVLRHLDVFVDACESPANGAKLRDALQAELCKKGIRRPPHVFTAPIPGPMYGGHWLDVDDASMWSGPVVGSPDANQAMQSVRFQRLPPCDPSSLPRCSSTFGYYSRRVGNEVIPRSLPTINSVGAGILLGAIAEDAGPAMQNVTGEFGAEIARHFSQKGVGAPSKLSFKGAGLASCAMETFLPPDETIGYQAMHAPIFGADADRNIEDYLNGKLQTLINLFSW